MSDAWEKLPALDGRVNPCGCCPPIPATAPMEKVIAVGFGSAGVTRDDEEVYREPSAYEHRVACPSADCHDGYTDVAKTVVCGTCGGLGEIDDPAAPEPEYWAFADAESAAAADPDHDWRVTLFGPLHGEVYQRHSPGVWNLIEKNEGFA